MYGSWNYSNCPAIMKLTSQTEANLIEATDGRISQDFDDVIELLI